MISRLAPTPQGEYQQVIVANPDQVVFVFACADPAPRLRMLDRFLVSAERQAVPALIVANKVDLVGLERGKEIFESLHPNRLPGGVHFRPNRQGHRRALPTFEREDHSSGRTFWRWEIQSIECYPARPGLDGARSEFMPPTKANTPPSPPSYSP